MDDLARASRHGAIAQHEADRIPEVQRPEDVVLPDRRDDGPSPRGGNR